MGGSPSLPNNPTPAYQFANQPGADAGAYGGIQNLNTNPSVAYNAPASTAAGSALTTTGMNVLPYVNQTLQTGFDPQNALYAKQFQQQQDQSNVVNAQNGVAMTPYGAGLVNQNNQNFDINWQNAQLGRQQTAAGTAQSLIGAGSTGATTGTSVGQSVPSLQNQFSQQQIADFLSYLQGGTGAANAATGQYSAEASANLGAAQQQNQGMAGLGTLAGDALGFLFA